MTRLRLALRLARREVLRRPGRTLLVTLLVAVPVAGTAGAAVLVRSDRMTSLERWQTSYGQADAVAWEGPGRQVALDRLPVGSRTLRVTDAYSRARTPGQGATVRRSEVEWIDIDVHDPLASGVLDLRRGAAPGGADEIALGPAAAERFGVTIGDTLTLEHPPAAFTVVGIVERGDCLRCPTALVAPGHIPPAAHAPSGPSGYVLIDLPDQPVAELRSLAARDSLDLRPGLRSEPTSGEAERDGEVRWTLVIGAVVLTVLGIVITAAFAVGARRQLVTLGQLASGGADPVTVRRSLVLQGSLTGLVGAVVGVVAGVALVHGFRGVIEEILGRRLGTFEVRGLDVALAGGSGVVAATVAALIPARSAAQVPVLAALAGRRPLTPVSRRQVAAGLVAVAVGLALLALAVLGSASGSSGDVWVLVAILGGVTELLGACAVAPAVASTLEPLGARLRGPWRLAARGLARNRTRTGAVIAGVAAAGALAVVAAAFVRGAEAEDDDRLDFPTDAVVVRAPVEQPSDVRGGTLFGLGWPDPAVRAELSALLGDDGIAVRSALAPAAERHLDRPAVVVEGLPDDPGSSLWFDQLLVADDEIVEVLGLTSDGRRRLAERGAALVQRDQHPDARLVTFDGTTVAVAVVAGDHTVSWGADVLITEDRARELGFEVGPGLVLYRAGGGFGEEVLDNLGDLVAEEAWRPTATADGGVRYLDVRWHEPDGVPSPLQLELLLSGVALVFSLLVIGTALALVAAESRDERDVLTTAGAGPRTLARAAGARAWLLAALGAALALPVGFLPVVVFTRAQAGGMPLVFPTATVVVLLVATPVVVGVSAFGASAVTQRLRPVRVSTAVFE